MSEYGDWPREKLIEHIEAYGAGLHELGKVATSQQRKIERLERRLNYIDNTRRVFHGA